MALSDDIVNNSIQGIQQGGPSSTVGDAISAYKMAQDLQVNQQKLQDMKDKNAVDKMTAFYNQLDTLNRMTPVAQQLAIKSLSPQWKQMFPTMNPDITEALSKDKEFRAKALQLGSEAALNIAKGMQPAPEGYDALSATLGGDVPNFYNTVEKFSQQNAQVKAAQYQAAAMSGRSEAMKDSGTQAAFDKFTKDAKLPNLEDLGKKLDRDSIMLKSSDPKKPVTYQQVHEVLQNVATVLGNGQVSDSRVNSITPLLGDEKYTKLQQLFDSDPNKPAKPELVEYAAHLVNRLNGAVGADVVARARTIGAQKDADLFHNPNIAEATKRKVNFYESGQWRSNYGEGLPNQSGQSPPQASTAPAGSGGGPGGAMSFEQFMATRK